MTRPSRLAVYVLLVSGSLTAPLAAQQAMSRGADMTVGVDSARHEVVLTIGTFSLPAMAAGHAGHEGHDQSMMPRFKTKFVWPVTGMGRGFRMELRDGSGKKVSQRVLHHLQIINGERRQLLLPMEEKLMAIGRETRNLMLPNTIGMPLTAGTGMKLDIMWHNETKTDYDSVMITLRIRYSPANLVPTPVIVLPITMDVADAKGRPNTFTIPAGDFTVQRDFVMPVDGHIIGLSGHMHDYGRALRLEEAPSGKVLTQVLPQLDAEGKISHMPVKLYGIVGDGIRVHAGRRYRLVAVYHNPTDHPIAGAMAHLNGLISPSNMQQWPANNSTEVAYQDDGAAAIATVPTPTEHQHQHE